MRESWTDERLEDFRENVDARFDRFEGLVDARFEQVDARFDRFEARVDARFEQVDLRFDRFEAQVDARFNRLEAEIGELRRLMMQGFFALTGITVTGWITVIGLTAF